MNPLYPKNLPKTDTDFQLEVKPISYFMRHFPLLNTVNTHIVFNVVPALWNFKRGRPEKELHSYKCTFKMLLDRKIPERTDEESGVLYLEYLPRLACEITKRVLDILDRRLVPSDRYFEDFKFKFVSIYNAFIELDCEGCKLPEEKVKSIQGSAALEGARYMYRRWNVHKAIEDYVTEFLRPYKSGLITKEDKEALNRPKLILGLEKFLLRKLGQVPYKADYIELLALDRYMFECAGYILDQFESQTGKRPSAKEFPLDSRCRLIFRGCLEAVHDAIEIDFPDITLSNQALRSKLMKKLSL